MRNLPLSFAGVQKVSILFAGIGEIVAAEMNEPASECAERRRRPASLLMRNKEAQPTETPAGDIGFVQTNIRIS